MAKQRGPEHVSLAAGRVLAGLGIEGRRGRSPAGVGGEMPRKGGVTGSKPEWGRTVTAFAGHECSAEGRPLPSPEAVSLVSQTHARACEESPGRVIGAPRQRRSAGLQPGGTGRGAMRYGLGSAGTW